MDCCSCVITLESSFALLLGTSFALVLAYFVNLLNANTTELSAEADSEEITCQSLNCIRCNHDVQFLENAKSCFINYYRNRADEELCLLAKSILSSDRINKESRYLLYLRGLSSAVWFNPKLTHESDVNKLQKNYSVILEEFYRINGQEGWIVNERKGCWRVFHLVSQGRIVEENASKCPRTMNIIRNLNHAMLGTIFGYVTFSVMEPGTIISPHYGSTNCRVRCHLGLKADPNVSYIEVAGKQKSWEDGRCLIFDDSFLHSAYHNGSENSDFRAVLMVDMWHPRLSKAEIDCIRAVYTADLMLHRSLFH